MVAIIVSPTHLPLPVQFTNASVVLQLCFVGQDCQRIPSILGATYGLQTKRLDLSYNAIRSLEGLEKFPYLEEIILDNNFIDDNLVLPFLATLHTLSLNKNKVTNLEKLVEQIRERLPNLRYLSLLGNEACPDQLSCADKDEKDYRRYRLYVLNRLPTLKFLDSTGVRRSERREARTRGALSKTVRPQQTSPLSSTQAKMIYDLGGGGGNHSSTTSEVNHKPRRSAMDRREQNGSAGKRGTPEPISPNTHTGAYGFRRYRYVGQHSEGNRFINNEAL
ncbi:leucine-rich melanocyte differentiation-associated protein-like [Homarus americanus]|uniref:leucine-rich melanocyte differentiation-associated protein-like n=1 Tax=Homarus americanus TaxID=6706 RepID=UPI001C48A4FD|nr:leucine-rich melanocyte differentiation-associated protein-like [Homarus americanus]